MLNTLMMLLGLSQEGEEMLEVARDSNNRDLSPRQRRRRADRSNAESDVPPTPEPKRRRSARKENPDSPDGDMDGLGKESSKPSRKPKAKSPDLADLPLGDFGNQGSLPGGKSPDLTFSADDIISKNSKYSFHRRPLLNAEAMAQANQVEEAIEIFERTKNRIPDEEIQGKIKKNIEDLEGFLEENPPEDEANGDPSQTNPGKTKPGQDPGKSGAKSNLTDLVDALRQVSELFAESIARAIQYAQTTPPVQFPPPKDWQVPPGKTPEVTVPPVSGSLPPLVQPILYQMAAPPAAPNPALPSSAIQNLSPPPVGLAGPFVLPVPTSDSYVQAPVPASVPLDFQTLEKEVQKRDLTDLDLPEDTFFSEEWKKFKDLPLVDRRSGEERRKGLDRRTNTLGRKDRRSGEDRRKVDRFKEREEFLKNQALKKLEKKAQELREKGEEPSVGDLLKPYFPEKPGLSLPEPMELALIGLPDGIGWSPLAEPKEEEWLEPETEEGWFEKTTAALRKELELPSGVDQTLPKEGETPKVEPSFSVEASPSSLSPQTLPQESLAPIGLPDPEEMRKEDPVGRPGSPGSPDLEDAEAPEIQMLDGDLGEISEPPSDDAADKVEEEPERIIHGVLELKPPDVDDAPFLTLTYDFAKIPHAFRLSKNYSIMEYSYYKYKPMLMKAQEFARRKMLKNALNYYRVIKSQNIPPELRKMINRNIRDITEFMEKFLMAKGG